MSIYKEKKEKVRMKVSENEETIRIQVNCYYGTDAIVMFDYDGSKTVEVGRKVEIRKTGELKGKRVKINGELKNPDGEKKKVEHIFYEGEIEKGKYTFPDDYSGKPKYKDGEKINNYQFYLNVE